VASQQTTSDLAGSLRLMRVGNVLRFYAAARGKPPKEIGTTDYGDHPIDVIRIQVLAPALRSQIDVEFDNISVRADRITKREFTPEVGRFAHAWYLIGLFAIPLIWLWWRSYWRNR
jgi:hypothetical protein